MRPVLIMIYANLKPFKIIYLTYIFMRSIMLLPYKCIYLSMYLTYICTYIIMLLSYIKMMNAAFDKLYMFNIIFF